MSVQGKIIVITGAASGIGRAIAEGFHADGAVVLGADVAGMDGDWPFEMVRCDVADEAQVKALIDGAAERHGRLDVLFNNAGLGFRVPVGEHAPGQFEKLIAVNLFGPYYGIRAALPVMKAQGGGHIVNTLSRAAEVGGKGFAAYGASKGGLYTLTRSAAREALDDGILVNGLIPGPTKSGMNPNAPQDPADVYPTARWLAGFGPGDPTGRVFWNEQEYRIYDEANVAFDREIRPSG
ncbi:MAG: SDR family NAD(P)-dependent oxidoreductase [Minwuia sp.]|uniref:SDR family NAD(P)-dependent oxidoreductase n=1 Tax=Minwuia sp. TaxID=2493630 RepID=UPI003A87F912